MLKTDQKNRIAFPHIDKDSVTPEQWNIYKKFMSHLRHVPVSRVEIKILSAIQFTADILDCSDAHISKELVDVGLRAPRVAFPVEFLNYADHALMRCGWDIGGPNKALIELRDLWYVSNPNLNQPLFPHVHSLVEESALNG